MIELLETILEDLEQGEYRADTDDDFEKGWNAGLAWAVKTITHRMELSL